MGITIKTDLLHCIMVLYTSVDTHFPVLSETFRLFELFNAGYLWLLIVIDCEYNN